MEKQWKRWGTGQMAVETHGDDGQNGGHRRRAAVTAPAEHVPGRPAHGGDAEAELQHAQTVSRGLGADAVRVLGLDDHDASRAGGFRLLLGPSRDPMHFAQLELQEMVCVQGKWRLEAAG